MRTFAQNSKQLFGLNMENYIVSARKYRPATFETVIGQRALTTTLKNAIASGKLAHAYLFCGPRGVGKTTCARIFAKTINCLNPTADGEACNECESCRAFNEQRSYNIHELDAASNNSVDDIRQLVDQVRIPPQIGRYKVYIIDEVHMLSTSAFNAFLKTLEEPPRHAIFILATTEKHKILPTILSRCQIYDFSRIGVEDIVAHLAHVASKEGITAEPEALNVIALKADGGMRDALSIFDQVVSFTGGHISYQGVIENLNVLDYEYYFRLTDHFLAGRVSDSLLLFNEVLNKGFDGSHFINGLASHMRDLLVSRDEVTLPLLQVGASIRQRYLEQARQCTPSFLYKAMKLCNDCDLNYRTSKNKRLLVELTLIQVAQLTAGTDDAPDGGRSPKPVIQPVFQQAAAQPSQPAAQPKSAPAPTPAKPTADKKEIHSTPTILQTSREEKRIPVVNVGKLGVSIRPQAETPTVQPAQSAAPVKVQAPEENRSFTEQEANYYWQEYASRLPQEQIALAKRMQGIRLKQLAPTTCELVVDNDLVAREFKALQPTLQTYLQQKLRNRQAQLQIRISEVTEKKAFGRMEKFQMMATKNDSLMKLKEVFGLELYS